MPGTTQGTSVTGLLREVRHGHAGNPDGHDQDDPVPPATSALNKTGLWTHWSGHLAAQKYQLRDKHEYFGVRNSGRLLRLLAAVQVLGPRAGRRAVPRRGARARRADLPPGQGAVHVLVRRRRLPPRGRRRPAHGDNEFMLTAPSRTSPVRDLVGRLDVDRRRLEEYGVLAVQGPRSREILARLAPDVAALPYFGARPGQGRRRRGDRLPHRLHRRPRLRDLRPRRGRAARAGRARGGAQYGIRPFGDGAAHGPHRGRAAARRRRLLLEPLRLDRPRPGHAGRARLGLDAARHRHDERAFVGRRALRAEIAERDVALGHARARRRLAGLGPGLDEAGLVPPKDETPLDYESMLYDDGRRAGRLRDELHVLAGAAAPHRASPGSGPTTAPGSTVSLEVTVNHQYETVAAQVARLPLFNPERKTA